MMFLEEFELSSWPVFPAVEVFLGSYLMKSKPSKIVVLLAVSIIRLLFELALLF
jgi:hypothetical protein